MRHSWLFALLLSGCFFEKETPPIPPDLHQGGSIMLPQCGYTVYTKDGASIPAKGTNMFGPDGTPRFVHIGTGGDPRTQIAILWRTVDETTLATTVQYGEGSATDQTQTGFTFVYDLNVGGEVRMHETHLCGLKPDTQYSYRVGGSDGNGNDHWSPVYTFRTAPDRTVTPSAMVTLLVLGDTRDGYSKWGSTLKTAYQMATPDFILFSGDGTTLGPIQDEWDAWFTAADPILASTPMILAHGNHDVNAVNWFSQFAMPGDEQNFSVEIGPIHLTVANDTPMDAASLTGGGAQLLDQNLGAPSGQGASWSILMQHKPFWSAAAGPHPEDAVNERTAWGAIVDSHKVDLDISGHDHDYERTKPMRGMTAGTQPSDGTIYVVVGSAGATLYDSGSDYWTETSSKTFSFAIVRIMPGMLQMNAFKDDGSMLDALTITK